MAALAWLLVWGPVHADTVAVVVSGVDGDLLTNARAFLDIVAAQSTEDLTPARIALLHRRAPEQVRRALEPLGYYGARVEAALTRDGEAWTARYQVTPGEPARVQTVDLHVTGPGAHLEEFAAARERFPLAPGDVLVHTRYEAGKRPFLAAAAELGFLDAGFTHHRVVVDAAGRAATVTLHFATGPRYRFGPVTFTGSNLREDLLRRYLTFREGDPYQAAGLVALQTVLNDSRYFARVAVDPRREEAREEAIPVAVTLADNRRDRYRFGIGLGTDTGPRASVGWQRRQVNRRGHRAAADLQVSSRATRLEGEYTLPLARPASEALTFSARAADETSDSRESRALRLGVSRAETRGRWRETRTLAYQQERFVLEGDPEEDSRMLLGGVSWNRGEADDPAYPARGFVQDLEVMGALEALFSDATLLRIHGSDRRVFSPWPRWRLLTRVELGALATGDLERVPASLRFYAGGDQSVRGYGLEALGPRDRDGDVRGGRYLAAGSLEAERQVHGNWGAAVFLDAGNAFDDLGEGLEAGLGFGLRWRSPLGLVRLDLANAVTDPERPWRLHLSIGPDL